MLKFLNKKVKKDEKGLTLVELLAVVVILAIVAAIAFIVIGNVISNSKKDAHVANAQQIIEGVKLAEASGDVTDEKLKTDGYDVLKEELGTIGSLVDPWGKKPYNTALVKKKEDDVYLVTLTPEGKNEECVIENTNEEKLQKGRKAVCDGEEEQEG